jgi:hypothetical protein
LFLSLYCWLTSLALILSFINLFPSTVADSYWKISSVICCVKVKSKLLGKALKASGNSPCQHCLPSHPHLRHMVIQRSASLAGWVPLLEALACFLTISLLHSKCGVDPGLEGTWGL